MGAPNEVRNYSFRSYKMVPGLRVFVLHLLLLQKLQHLLNPPTSFHTLLTTHLKVQQNKLCDHSSFFSNESAPPEIFVSYVVAPVHVWTPIVSVDDSGQHFSELVEVLMISRVVMLIESKEAALFVEEDYAEKMDRSLALCYCYAVVVTR